MSGMTRKTRTATLAAVALLPLALAACGSGSTSSTSIPNEPAASAPAADAASQVFGAGCAAVPKDGLGSFNGMATDPVATAASHNPALSTLVTAVTKAGLADSLNTAN